MIHSVRELSPHAHLLAVSCLEPAWQAEQSHLGSVAHTYHCARFVDVFTGCVPPPKTHSGSTLVRDVSADCGRTARDRVIYLIATACRVAPSIDPALDVRRSPRAFRYLLREVPYRSSDNTHGLSLVLGRQSPLSSVLVALELLRSFRALGWSPSSGGTTHGLSLVLGRQPPLSSVSVALELSDGDPSSGGATHGLSLVLGRQPPLSSVFVALELSDDPVVSPSGRARTQRWSAQRVIPDDNIPSIPGKIAHSVR